MALSRNNPINATDDLERDLTRIVDDYRQQYDRNFMSLRQAIPREEIWRFLVDGKHQNLGWEARYEKGEQGEPGYLFAMTAAFAKILNQTAPIESASELDSFIKDLHLTATTNVDKLLYAVPRHAEEERGLYRKSVFVCTPLATNESEAGMEELLLEIKNHPADVAFPVIFFTRQETVALTSAQMYFAKFFGSTHPVGVTLPGGTERVVKYKNFYLIPDAVADFHPYDFRQISRMIPEENVVLRVDASSLALIKEAANEKIISLIYFVNDIKKDDLSVKEVIEKKMYAHIEHFLATFKQAKSDLDKLKCILSFNRHCERTHPFLDRNTCVFSMLLLNYLLITNGFPPVIRDDPNHCYAYTIDEMTKDVLIGMRRTLNLAKGMIPYRVSTQEHYNKLPEMRKLYFQKSVGILNHQLGDFLFPTHHLDLLENNALVDSLLMAGTAFIELIKASPGDVINMLENDSKLMPALKLYMLTEREGHYRTLAIIYKNEPIKAAMLANIHNHSKKITHSYYFILLCNDLLNAEILGWLANYPPDVREFDNLKGEFVETLILLKRRNLLSTGMAFIRDHFDCVIQFVVAIRILDNKNNQLTPYNLSIIAENPTMAVDVASEVRAKRFLIKKGMTCDQFDALSSDVKKIVVELYGDVGHFLWYFNASGDILAKLFALPDKKLMKLICVNAKYVTDLHSKGISFDVVISLKEDILKAIFSKCFVIEKLINRKVSFSDIVALEVATVRKILDNHNTFIQLLDQKKLSFASVSSLTENQLDVILTAPASDEATSIFEALQIASDEPRTAFRI